MLIGLDKNNLNIRDLYQEIQNKLKNQVGRIDMKNILIIDNESLISKFE